MPAGVRANNWAFNRWAQPAQRVARGRLAEMQAFGGAGDAALMRVRLPIPPSREALQPPVRVASARSISIPVRKSIGPSRSTDQENLVRCGLHEKAGERFGRRLQGSGLGAGRRALIDLD
jgi:hypothetical protein